MNDVLDDARYATVSGGQDNRATNLGATVSGGAANTASGAFATVAGGDDNDAAGDFSFAAGRRANVDANHGGSFLYADHTDFDFNSVAANEFAVRATGGVRFVTAISPTGESAAGVRLAAGGGSWQTLSDRQAKANFTPVDQGDILARLMTVPITTWNYSSQSSSIQHLGPTGQDFFEAFGLGEEERYINTVDADGVALAAIQGLHQLTQAQQAQITAQAALIAALETRLAALEQEIRANATSTPDR
jgi:hypothetical protein